MSHLAVPLSTSSTSSEAHRLADLHADAISDREALSGPIEVERLLAAVEAHIAAESDTLPEYERLGRETGDPIVELLMRLILEDETHHHGLLQRIAASLRDALYWSHSPEALPPGHLPAAKRTRQAVVDARALIQEELDGARKLRQIAHDQRAVSGGLVSILLEAMAHDSEKHAKLLQFVQKRLEEHALT